MQEIAPVIAFVGILIFLAHLFTGIFSRTRIPDVILLMAIGIGLGPVLGVVSPASFGEVGPVFTTITLIIILFEGGMALKLGTLRTILGGVLKLAPLNFFLTMAVVTGFVLWLTNLELIPALILGAIVGSTSETVVIPLVNQLRMRVESQSLLSVESSLNDVLSIVITVALIEAYQIGKLDITSIFADLLAAFFVATIFGVVGALVWSILLNRIHAIKNAMFTTPAFIFVIFGVMEMLGFSGAIAALAFGITIGNIELIRFPIFKTSPPNEPVGLTETEKVFFSEVAFLLKTFFFVYLGISLELLSGWLITLGLILTVVAFVLRIPAVRLSVGKSMPIKDVSIVAVMVPKGLAAVVLSSIPLQQGVVGGDIIRDITYVVVLLSIVFTSFLVLLLDKTRFLGVYNWLLSVPLSNFRPRRIFSSRKQSDATGGKIVPSGAKMFGSGDKSD